LEMTPALARASALAVVIFSLAGATASASPQRLHSSQAVINAFRQTGITLRAYDVIRSAGPLHGATVIDMPRLEANQRGFDVGAYVFPSSAAAALFEGTLNVVRGMGALQRRIDNVFFVVTTMTHGQIDLSRHLRAFPLPVRRAFSLLAE
jgi:hypothetical protein